MQKLVLSFLILASGVCHAANKPSSGGKVEILTPDGDRLVLEDVREPGASLETRVETEDPVLDQMINEPREITLKRYSPISTKNRAEQEAAARKVAEELAEKILSPENLSTEEAMIRTQDALSTALGKLPEGALSVIESILLADLSALNDPSREPQYRRDTNNALAELTRVMTDFRQRGVDVNTAANFLNRMGDRLSRVPVVGGLFTSSGDVLRQRFQTVLQATQSILSTLGDSTAHLRLRHEQMKNARLELTVLERYLEISELVADHLMDIINDYKANAGMDEAALATFDKNISLPLAGTRQMIQRQQATVVTAYHQFRLLMDRNLDLIRVISNIRGLAQLEIKVFGAGRIIANEQQRMMDMARSTLDAMDEMRKKTIEQLKSQGIQARDFTDKLIQSSAELVDLIDVLLAELAVARETDQITITKLNESADVLKTALSKAKEKGGTVDLIQVSDQVDNTVGRRKLDDLNQPVP